MHIILVLVSFHFSLLFSFVKASVIFSLLAIFIFILVNENHTVGELKL